jgi:glutamate dehydrogenase (NAD(P)+)
MDSAFRFADDLGPAKIILVHEPACALKAVLVVDNVAAGPAIGGLRMAPDVSVEECARLARAMTLKNAAAGLAHGGGKSVLFGDPRMPRGDKERLIRAFAGALADERDYIFGPDMGTDEQCMAWVHDEIGRAVGLPRELGGIPLDEIGATGWGLAHATEVALQDAGFPLAGARVAIQGFGAVGRNAMRFLGERGAVLVAASDTGGTLHDPDGIDIAALTALKKAGRSVVSHDRGEALTDEAILDVACDIGIPAARPDVINESNAERLNTRLVVEGANIPATEAAERRLHQRGILCVPDFIANAGGVICAAVEYHGGTQSTAFAVIEEKLRRNTDEVLRDARERGVTPRVAAVQLAAGRVRKAMATRRWGVF